MDARAAPAPRLSVRALCVLFFFSGFPALVYQLVWQRALFRIFGVNVESVTIVVTAFMVGLGAGSLAGGALSRRRGVPLLPLLAAIELATGAFGLVSLRVFDAVSAAALHASTTTSAALALALVLVPTLLMGAALPVLVGHLVRRTANVGGSVGLLYSANTLGAGVACLVSAGALFPFLGMQGSLRVAVALNAAVAAAALAAWARGAATGPDAREPLGAPLEAVEPGAIPPRTPRFAAALLLAAMGGLVSLSYEIFFFRAVSYATGSSASAFAVTLFAFLAGLAGGARAAGRSCAGGAAADGVRRALVAGSALGWAFLPAVGRAATLGWVALPLALAGVYAVARCLGVLLPALAHAGVRADRDAGLRTAQLYLANIAGSAMGSVVTGFVLMDRLTLSGLAAALVAAGLACALLADATLAGPAPGRAVRAITVSAGGALAIALLPALSAGALERLMWKRSAPGKPPFVRVVENRAGIVAVDASGAVFGQGMYDGRFNVDLAHDTNGIVRAYALGLFHPAPRDVLMIGLASGSWAQVVANHPDVRSLTVVEINPGCVELIRGAPAVASLLANPKVTIRVDDGRRWLRRHPERRFDAVVSNTTYYFRANVSSLLSAEFLALVREHLRPGGVFLYNTTGSARVQRTGCLAFPHGARFSNALAVSATPLDVSGSRWRRTLGAWRIDGRPVLDPTRPEDRRVLDALAPEDGAADGAAPATLETCPQILARTAGREPVTDDNMGSEWRFIYGLE